MRNIKLVPVIELPHPPHVWLDNGSKPDGSWLTNPDEWEQYWVTLNKMSGYRHFKSFPTGSGLYHVEHMSIQDLNVLIQLHISDLPIEESCAFFGGYVLVEDETPILMPQCCGTLADFKTWEAISRSGRFQEWLCLDCHPCPEAISDGNIIEIRCVDEYESFTFPAPESYKLSRDELKQALHYGKSVLTRFYYLLESWGELNGQSQLSQFLYESE